jgi:hypothetical protein
MCFDGIMVENDSRLDIESAIVSAHQAVLEGMGMTIKLVSKPFETLDVSMFSNDEVHKVRHDLQFETIGAIAKIVDLDAEVAAKCGYKTLTRCGEWVWDAGDGKSFAIDDSGWILDRSNNRVIDNILSRNTVLPELKGMDVTIHTDVRVKEFATIVPVDTPEISRNRLMRLRAGTETPDENPPVTRPRMSFGKNKDGRDYDVMCVVAGMGAGKTYRSKRAISHYLAESKNLRCISLSCRIAYADFVTGLLPGFESYQTNPNADHLVCSLESLHSIKNTDFDVVWLDEFRSLLESLTSIETNKYNLAANLHNFRKIVQNPGVRIIISDADLLIDDAFEHVMNEFFTNKAVRVDVYPNLLASMKKDFTVVPESASYTSMCEDLKLGKKIGVVCDTKTAVLEIEQIAVQLKVEHIVFHGDTDQSTSRKMWKNPDFAKFKLVVWNSKITAGNDVTEAFDQIYYLGPSGKCATFKDGVQGLGRFRSVKIPNVFTVLPRPTWQSHGMLAKIRLEEAGAITTKCKDAHAREFPAPKKRPEDDANPEVDLAAAGVYTTPGWFAALQCYNTVLHTDEFFRFNFIRLQLSRGHNVFIRDGTGVGEQDIPDYVNEARLDSAALTEDRVRTALATIHNDMAAVERADKNKRRGLASMEENVLVDVYYTVKPFTIKGVETSFEDVYKFAKSNRVGLGRLLRYMQNVVDLPKPSFNDQSSNTRTYKDRFDKLLEQLKVGVGVTKAELKVVYDSKNTQELLKLLSIPDKRVGWSWRFDQLLSAYCHQFKSERKRGKSAKGDDNRVRMYNVEVYSKALRIVSDVIAQEERMQEDPAWKVLAASRNPAQVVEEAPPATQAPERERPEPFAFSTDATQEAVETRSHAAKHAFQSQADASSVSIETLFEQEVAHSGAAEVTHRRTADATRKRTLEDKRLHRHRVQLERERLQRIITEREEVDEKKKRHGKYEMERVMLLRLWKPRVPTVDYNNLPRDYFSKQHTKFTNC